MNLAGSTCSLLQSSFLKVFFYERLIQRHNRTAKATPALFFSPVLGNAGCGLQCMYSEGTGLQRDSVRLSP